MANVYLNMWCQSLSSHSNPFHLYWKNKVVKIFSSVIENLQWSGANVRRLAWLSPWSWVCSWLLTVVIYIQLKLYVILLQPMITSYILKNAIERSFPRCYPPFPGRVANKIDYRSLRLLTILQNVLKIMIWVLGLYKKCAIVWPFLPNFYRNDCNCGRQQKCNIS